MLKFKNKEGQVVLAENTETGELKVFDEKLKELETHPDQNKKEEEADHAN